MPNFKHPLLAAAAFCACGCMASVSGDIKVDRETASAMLEDRSGTPYAELTLVWNNFPYRDPTEAIAGGTRVDDKGNFLPPEPVSAPVPAETAAALLAKAKKIFAQAGLYDPARGQGALRLTLTTRNRWTYRGLFSSYLVDTGFIYIIPSSLPVLYELRAADGVLNVINYGAVKTTFHLLLAPLYPFANPGSKEKNLLNQLLWRTATDVYSARARGAAAPRPAAVQPQAEAGAAQPAAVVAAPQAPPAPEHADD